MMNNRKMYIWNDYYVCLSVQSSVIVLTTIYGISLSWQGIGRIVKRVYSAYKSSNKQRTYEYKPKHS